MNFEFAPHWRMDIARSGGKTTFLIDHRIYSAITGQLIGYYWGWNSIIGTQYRAGYQRHLDGEMLPPIYRKAVA